MTAFVRCLRGQHEFNGGLGPGHTSLQTSWCTRVLTPTVYISSGTAIQDVGYES